jgi:hypothetical protein
MKNKNIWIAVAIIIGAFVAGFLYSVFVQQPMKELQEQVAEIENDKLLEEFSQSFLQDKGNTCLNNAWQTYSDTWDQKCFNKNEREDCLLALVDRVDLTMEYNSDRIECLIEIN